MTNSAKILKKYIMNVQLEAMSPLRIASGMDDGVTDILILKDKQGNAFIPGTSMTGALKAAMEEVYGDEVASRFFGDIDEDSNQSMINISDVYLTNVKGITRDGVAIDSFTGVSINGAKYDYEAIDRGAKGKLCLEITVRQFNQEAGEKLQLSYRHKTMAAVGDVYGELCATIADLLSSGISIGSLTAKGYGRMTSKESATVYCYDFSKKEAVSAWLRYIENGKQDVKAYYTGSKDVLTIAAADDFVLEADFALSSSLIVRDMEAARELSTSKETLAAVQMKSGNDYVIPGTSVKGVLRNKAVRILTAISKNPTKAKAGVAELMGFAEKTSAQKSRLLVEEIYINNNAVKENKHTRNRINRFTGGTIDSALFTEVPVWQQDKTAKTVTMKLKVQKCTEEEAGLMLLLVRELWLGSLSFGGGKSVGRGVLKGKAMRIAFKGNEYAITGTDMLQIKGDKSALEGYVKKLGVKYRG